MVKTREKKRLQLMLRLVLLQLSLHTTVIKNFRWRLGEERKEKEKQKENSSKRQRETRYNSYLSKEHPAIQHLVVSGLRTGFMACMKYRVTVSPNIEECSSIIVSRNAGCESCKQHISDVTGDK